MTGIVLVEYAEASDEANRDSRPTRQDHRDWHRAVLLVAAVIIGLSLVLSVRDDGKVALIGLSNWPLPETCGLRSTLGINCPGCGLTRSFVYLAHGEWQRSLAIHRIGWLVAVFFVLQIPYRWLALRQPQWTLSSAWAVGVVTFFSVALFGNWIYNLLNVMPSTFGFTN
ncbi:MAG: DUF2752 domain-containing protein [Planctomycetes bacterium]|nr:DUF2752 domain-containing protein [Planctomycetota bacterium]